MKKDVSIKLVRQEKKWVQNVFVKNFKQELDCQLCERSSAQNSTENTKSIEHKAGSGRPPTVRTQQNIECVTELICSQVGNPGSSKSLREIETRIWANAQRDGRPAEYRWCPLFNAAKFD